MDGSEMNATSWIASRIVAPLLIAAVLGVAGWAWSLQTGHAGQDKEIGVHETRLDWHDKALDRFDAKLDRILERLGAGP